MDSTQAPDPPAALPRGTRLGEFELLRVLGIGGFGIVYLAFDHALEREVAVKEYMPSSLVGRTATQQVSLLSQANAESFALGLRSFVNEARLLARFDHPALVKVLRYWEANGTAYMAMPYYTGSNLHALRRKLLQPPGEAWLRGILDPLLGALERLHQAGVFHRDISPDNVILQPDGLPVLLDFGAARRVLGDKSMALTAILKPAYAPIEQYAEAGAVKQGPWTDLYSLGATLHYLLLRRAPAPATTRTVVDEMQPLAAQQATLPGCSTAFLQLIDWMLQPRPADRPQSVTALRDALARLALPAPVTSVDSWSPTQALHPTTRHTPDITVVDLSQLPAAAPVRPKAVEATQVMSGLQTATQVMSRLQPPLDEGATQALPRADHDDEAPTAPLSRPDAAPAADAVPPGSTQAGLPPAAPMAPHVPIAPAARAPQPLGARQPPAQPRVPPVDPQGGVRPDEAITGEARAPRPAPSRSTLRWPIIAGLAGLLGLGLWLGLRPTPSLPADSAGGSAPPVAAASAAAAAASEAASASAVVLEPPSPAPSATAAVAPPSTTLPPAEAAASIAPGASGQAAGPVRQPPQAATAYAATPVPRVAITRPSTTPTAALPRMPAAAKPSAERSDTLPRADNVAPGLATSITRLPPAAESAASGAAAGRLASAVPSASASPLNPPPASTAPANAATTSPELGRPPAGTPAAHPPVATTTPAATSALPVRPAALPREAEPVLLQARALSPSERCEGRVLVALWACIDRACKSDASLREHADCVKLRRDQERGGAPAR